MNKVIIFLLSMVITHYLRYSGLFYPGAQKLNISAEEDSPVGGWEKLEVGIRHSSSTSNCNSGLGTGPIIFEIQMSNNYSEVTVRARFIKSNGNELPVQESCMKILQQNALLENPMISERPNARCASCFSIDVIFMDSNSSFFNVSKSNATKIKKAVIKCPEHEYWSFYFVGIFFGLWYCLIKVIVFNVVEQIYDDQLLAILNNNNV